MTAHLGAPGRAVKGSKARYPLSPPQWRRLAIAAGGIGPCTSTCPSRSTAGGSSSTRSAVIVVGIAIALGGEECSGKLARASPGRQIAWRDQGRARGQPRPDEVRGCNTADCIDRRLDEIAALYRAARCAATPVLGRPAAGVDDADQRGRRGPLLWLADRPPARRANGDFAPSTARCASFAEIEKDEQWAWAELRSITEDRDLTDSDKAACAKRSSGRAMPRGCCGRRNPSDRGQRDALGVQPDQASARLAIGVHGDGHAVRRGCSQFQSGQQTMPSRARRTQSAQAGRACSQRHSISTDDRGKPDREPGPDADPAPVGPNASQVPMPRPTPQ